MEKPTEYTTAAALTVTERLRVIVAICEGALEYGELGDPEVIDNLADILTVEARELGEHHGTGSRAS